MNWSAEISNDPAKGFELYVELLEGDAYRGRIFRNETGQLILRFYRNDDDVSIPLEWLVGIVDRAEQDLRRKSE